MMSSFWLAFKALRELGPRQLGLYAIYCLGLRTGTIRRGTQKNSQPVGDPRGWELQPVLQLPKRSELIALLGEPGLAQLLSEADEIAAGQVRLFGSEPVPLRLSVPGPLEHWTAYEHGLGGLEGDIKFTWEPARFGWAFTLGRAYTLGGDERYAAAFWDYTENFLDANPPYLGPHWVSAQEAALRMMAFVFAAQVFDASPHTTPERKLRLGMAVADHAARIPPTLVYARAQNNNHLLSEAVGLYTAGSALLDHPASPDWRKLGWRWFKRGMQDQITADGAYVQHSTNYHRLMLQLALWMNQVAKRRGERLPDEMQARLAAATGWLLWLLDPESGSVPNLGPNDGAYILPLTGAPFHDYRPVLLAAAETFLDENPFGVDSRDEMQLWLGEQGTQERQVSETSPQLPPTPGVLRNAKIRSWAYLRGVQFRERPGHADQLHLDLWWRGLNVAQDAGTYLYNAPPPWNNSLTNTAVHNTVTINGLEQMIRAGRFLYLGWAQAKVVNQEQAADGSYQQLTVQHDGYRRLGVLHQRKVTTLADGCWLVEDAMLPTGKVRTEPLDACLFWLLPDWPWTLEKVNQHRVVVSQQSPQGVIQLAINAPSEQQGSDSSPSSTQIANVQIIRASELISGSGEISPTWGWVSPTYGVKRPALALRTAVRSPAPFSMSSEWIFPVES